MRLARSVTIAPRGESYQLGSHLTHYATRAVAMRR